MAFERSTPAPRPARGPVGRYIDAELVTQIGLVLAATAFLGEGYRKAWRPRNHDGTIIPDAPDVRWGTDLTGAWTAQAAGVSVMPAAAPGH